MAERAREAGGGEKRGCAQCTVLLNGRLCNLAFHLEHATGFVSTRARKRKRPSRTVGGSREEEREGEGQIATRQAGNALRNEAVCGTSRSATAAIAEARAGREACVRTGRRSQVAGCTGRAHMRQRLMMQGKGQCYQRSQTVHTLRNKPPLLLRASPPPSSSSPRSQQHTADAKEGQADS